MTAAGTSFLHKNIYMPTEKLVLASYACMHAQDAQDAVVCFKCINSQYITTDKTLVQHKMKRGRKRSYAYGVVDMIGTAQEQSVYETLSLTKYDPK